MQSAAATPRRVFNSKRHYLAQCCASALWLGLCHSAVAGTNEPADASIERIAVSGRADSRFQESLTASEGEVSGSDLAIRPLITTAELLQAVPGLIAAQHSGSGKANQYFLRGFQLDHGTDFTASLDGVPLNFRSHGHGQGYLDVNGVIPESIDSIGYRKGPYFVEQGDFSLAGAALLSTVDQLPSDSLGVEVGSDGQRKVTLATDQQLAAQSNWLNIVQARQYDGPWQQKEQLRHVAWFSKYRTQSDTLNHELSSSLYRASWQPTEQIPLDAIGSTDCADRFCALDPTAKGLTERLLINDSYQADSWQANWYAQHYNWWLVSNPTYEDDGQIKQQDQRFTLGGQAQTELWRDQQQQWQVGASVQHDQIRQLGLAATRNGQWQQDISQYRVGESSAAVYADWHYQWSSKLALDAGLRRDQYRFAVTPLGVDTALEQKVQLAGLWSPKLNVQYLASESLALYASYGKGFHSNDARGLVAQEPIQALAPGAGHEFGVRGLAGELRWTYAYWWLQLDSELIFVGDSNSVEPKGGANRQGYEVTLYYPLSTALQLDLNFSQSQAQYQDAELSGGSEVEGSIAQAAEVGLTADWQQWVLSSRLRYQGGYALLADNSQRASPTVQWHLRLSREVGAFQYYAEVLNLTNRQGSDIEYWYENKFAPEGGRVRRSQLPRSVRLGLVWQF